MTKGRKIGGKQRQPCIACKGELEVFSVSVRIARRGFTVQSPVIAVCRFCLTDHRQSAIYSNAARAALKKIMGAAAELGEDALKEDLNNDEVCS